MAKKIVVLSPVESFSGVSVGVTFSHGVGVVEEDSPAHKYFLRKGYEFRESESSEADEPVTDGNASNSDQDVVEPPQIEIPGMPKKSAPRSEWVEYAESLGIEAESLTIAEIRERVIVEHITEA